MQLQKLRSHAKKIVKNRQKLKCISLGLIVPPQKQLTLTQQQLSQQMINQDSCLHKQNNNQVLIVQFRNQIPHDGKGYSKINRLYECFIKNIHTILDQVNEGEEEQQDRLYHIGKIEDNKTRLQNLGENNKIKSKKELAIIVEQMTRIYQQADKKHQIKRYRIGKIQKQIQKLYIQSHQYYLQLMQIKSAIQASRILSQKQSLQNSENLQQNFQQYKNQSNPQILNNQSQIKINLQTQSPRQKQKQQPRTILKLRSRTISITIKNTKQYQDMNNKITKVRQIIDKKQQQCRKFNQQQITIAQQKIGFLKLLLKNGYHLSDGICWILVKLAQNKVKLKINDFYDLLDMTTKQLLIQQYNQISQEVYKNKTISLPKIKQSASVKSKDKKQDKKQEKNRYENFSQISQARLINIKKYNTSLKIYKQTQDYIAQWVRKQKWRVRSLKHKPIQPQDSRKDWIHGQVIRLKKTYSKQKYEQITMYIFGSTKYYKKITPDKIKQFLIPRRHKDSSRDNDTILSSQKGFKIS